MNHTQQENVEKEKTYFYSQIFPRYYKGPHVHVLPR